MRRLRVASQPRSVRYGIPRRMRAQHQTTMTVHGRPEIEPWHEATTIKQAKQQKLGKTSTTKAGPRDGISKRIQEIQFKLNLN